MSVQRSVLFSHFLAHRNCDVPRPVAIVTHATEFLAHQAIRTGIDDLFKLVCDGIQTVKHALRHEPARLRRKSLEAIILIGWTFGFWSGMIFHRVGRTMAVTRPAQDTASAALFEAFGIEPFLDALEP